MLTEPTRPVFVPLRNRQGDIVGFAAVDLADVHRVAELRWFHDATGYAASGSGSSKKTYLHRFVMGCPPGDGWEVDHLNGDKLDRRQANLRKVTRGQNKQNLVAYRGSKSQYRGVCWNESKQAWEASVRLGGKRVFFKRFKDEDEAGAAAAGARARLMPFTSENTEAPPRLAS